MHHRHHDNLLAITNVFVIKQGAKLIEAKYIVQRKLYLHCLCMYPHKYFLPLSLSLSH